MSFKILTLNTWKCDGKYLQRLDWMGHLLETYQPDILMLQEVFRSTDGRFATDLFLAEKLGYRTHWTPARQKFRQIAGQMLDSYSGLAILSKHSCHFTETLNLPSNEADGGRAAQLAIFEIAGQQLLFANLHLSHLPKSDALKINQLRAVLDRLPVIPFELGFMAGDFNSTPRSETVKYLLAHPEWHIRDAYATTQIAEKFAAGATFYNRGRGKRIDYIFTISPPLTAKKCTITHAEVAMGKLGPEGLLPSDHFGVMATLQLV